MRKTLLGVVLLVSVAGFLLVSGMGSVARADGGPAIVIKNDGLCGMPGSDANGNITFGGPKRNRLFMAGSQSLYAVFVGIQGSAPA